jgi:maleylacetate reductase
MRAGEIVFTGMDRVTFGRPAADSIIEAAERLAARRV